VKQLILGACLAVAFGHSAQAQNLLATDPARIARAMQDAGYRAELTKDNSGDPMIRSAAGGTNFTVLFYNCENNRNCTTLQFRTAFATDQKRSLEVINTFNKDKRFARVYLDGDRDPVIEMDVNLDEGGVAVGNFVDNLKVFERLLGQFKQAIGW
jgi:hypothetical protein